MKIEFRKPEKIDVLAINQIIKQSMSIDMISIALLVGIVIYQISSHDYLIGIILYYVYIAYFISLLRKMETTWEIFVKKHLLHLFAIFILSIMLIAITIEFAMENNIISLQILLPDSFFILAFMYKQLSISKIKQKLLEVDII